MQLKKVKVLTCKHIERFYYHIKTEEKLHAGDLLKGQYNNLLFGTYIVIENYGKNYYKIADAIEKRPYS